MPSPYQIKSGIRFKRNSTAFAGGTLDLLVIDPNNNKLVFSSFKECSRSLNIKISIIKNCLLTGKTYKNSKFSGYYSQKTINQPNISLKGLGIISKNKK